MIKYQSEIYYDDDGNETPNISTYKQWYYIVTNKPKGQYPKVTDNKRLNNLIERCIKDKNQALLNINHEWDFIKYVCKRTLTNK